MTLISSLLDKINSFVPLIITLTIVGVTIWSSHKILIAKNIDLGSDKLFPKQIIMIILSLIGILAIALALPVSDSSKNQIIGLIGLLLSGLIAFSSSTIFANLMAGVMLRITKPFKIGDFIKVGEYFGRVVERGLFDTEIQTIDRELAAIPNTFLINNPIYVTRSSGAIISTVLSLGYDIHHSKIESLLIEAAKDCGLKEPFVQLLELGDFSITYKISGMLEDVKFIITARSNLCRCVLDKLHDNGIEIVSPTFMNQRKLPDNLQIIPTRPSKESVKEDVIAEEVLFDKAEKAEKVENIKQQIEEEIDEHKKKIENSSGLDKKIIVDSIKEKKEELKSVEKELKEE
ncbi:mechanosensitive ion channel [Deferribacteraceae bacterium V6Fe1]|nr:mechanosensitive ion channel [Deferribacteraceae bacterium V6Fe1]